MNEIMMIHRHEQGYRSGDGNELNPVSNIRQGTKYPKIMEQWQGSDSITAIAGETLAGPGTYDL